MDSDTRPAIERPSDLTASWLAAAIGAGAIADFAVERIGTGQMSECYRVRLSYADSAASPAVGPERPESVVLKVAATDPVSRQTGAALGLYEREVRFYQDVAPGLGGPIAPCYHASVDATGVFDLVLGDAGPAVVGDEIAGATAEQARLGVVELGRLHGPLLGDTALADAPWLNRESPLNQAMITPLYAAFVYRYGDQIAPGHRMVCERLVAAFDGYLAQESEQGRIQGLVHGDYRLDNMLFGAAGADRALTVVDWQTVSWGPALTDLAYFLGCALRTEDRRAQYDTLLRAYHEALGPAAPITLVDAATGIWAPVIVVATNNPRPIATVTRPAEPSRLRPRVMWFLIISWTPLISGTPGTMIIAGATRHRTGVPLAPSRTAAPPMTPLRQAAANGMTIGLK